MPVIQPKDIIATVTIIVLILLKLYRVEINIDPILTLILGYYFVKRQSGTDSGI